MFSLFILALYVFLDSAGTHLKWFTVDEKLLGLVGVAFVVALVIEAIFLGRPLLWRDRTR